MADYSNPAAFLADPSTESEQLSPVMHGMLSSMRAFQQMPFAQEMLKQTRMNTEQKQTELQEFQSPQAQAQRQAERQKIIDQGRVFHDTMQDEVQKSHEAARLRPYMTNQQIEEAKRDAQTAQHLFKTGPSTYFAGMFPIIEQLKKQGVPEEQIAQTYNSLVKNSGFDMSQMDDDVKEYKPSTMGALAMHRYSMIHTPEFEQKYALGSQEVAGRETVARIGVAGNMAALNAQIKAGRFDNDQRMVATLEKSIASGKDIDTGEKMTEQDIEQAKTQLRRYKSAKLMDFVNKDAGVQAAQMGAMVAQFSNDAGKQESARQQVAKAYSDATQRGIKMLGLTPNDVGAKSDAGHKVGDTITVQGSSVKVVAVNPDGTYRVQDSKGRTGTYKP